MQFSIGVGRYGSSTQWYLPGTDTSRLPAPNGGAAPPVAGALEEAVDGLDGAVSLLGGLVDAVGSPDAGAGFVLDVAGAWNSVKNGSFLSDGAARVTLSGFVHADAVLGDGGDSSVVLRGAKRGNVATGDGEDTVTIEAASNGSEWINEFRVATGDGGDAVVVRALDTAAAAASDPTFATTANGAGAFVAADANTAVVADLGAGDDSFFALGLSVDRVSAGAGDDVIQAGGGDDTLSGGDGEDLFIFAAGDGRDTVLDFRPGTDRLLFGLDADGARAVLDTALEADGATTLFRGADAVVLVGVAKAEIAAGDLL